MSMVEIDALTMLTNKLYSFFKNLFNFVVINAHGSTRNSRPMYTNYKPI